MSGVIVDTSALVAILLREPGSDGLLDAITEGGLLPAPARVEYLRVASGSRVGLAREAALLLGHLKRLGLDTVPFDHRHARIASEANARYGKGNGRGGLLNLLDLMVYAVAIDRQMPLLFTGRDFASTDVRVHVGSRVED
jgi:ribonuclease VapC